MNESQISWDLTELFTTHDDPKIDEIIKNLNKVLEGFIKEYKGKINAPNFTANDLLKLFKKQEDFESSLGEIMTFAYILYDANMEISESEALKNKVTQFSTEAHKKLAFLELEIGKYVYENESLIKDPLLQNYKHYLEKIRRSYPHLLSETEEQLVLEKDQFGIREWSQLQGKWLNTRKFKVMVEGVLKVLSYGEANSLLSHPDRSTRISADKSIYQKLGEDQYIFSTALRNICGDWMKMSARRKFNNPMHSSLIINDTTQEIIENLMTTVEKNVGVYQRYLRLKAKLLKIPKLNYADVLAPLLESPDKRFSWQEAKSLALKAYNNFDENFTSYVRDMFERNHIDASIRKGKRNGAYCASWYKGKSAFVLMPFAGQMREIYTLVHELGHAIHSYIASREQTYLNLHPGYTVSETASTFGEILLTDLLLEKSKSDIEKESILAQVLDETGMSVFQVSARLWFEQSLYDAISRGEYLDGQTISKYWVTGREKIYGDSVDFLPELIWEWAMKPHYFRIGLRFYNYPYVYAQLFVYALYQTYKKEGKEFIPKFKKLLAAGGSLSPEELGAIVGLDITKPDFWELGIKQYKEFVDELENLMK
ncbi:MAG: M3 family oligoendopeptidase [Promethearchaeota archaeon]